MPKVAVVATIIPVVSQVSKEGLIPVTEGAVVDVMTQVKMEVTVSSLPVGAASIRTMCIFMVAPV
jgi:hypothetical protein